MSESAEQDLLTLADQPHETIEQARQHLAAAVGDLARQGGSGCYLTTVTPAVDALISAARAQGRVPEAEIAIQRVEALEKLYKMSHLSLEESLASRTTQGRAQQEAEITRLRIFAEAVDAIRGDIIGRQTISWSAHVYPLVKALHEAGYHGDGYEEAKAKALTLIDLVKTAEARAEALAASLAQQEQEIQHLKAVIERGSPVQENERKS